MKKIPTIFNKVFDENDNYLGVSREWNKEVKDIDKHLTNGFKNIIPTIKYDGTACLILNGNIYRRYDRKRYDLIPDHEYRDKELKEIPKGSILCDDHLPPHEIWWVPCSENNSMDKYHIQALNGLIMCQRLCGDNEFPIYDGTYELIGKHFQNNPYGLNEDILIPHGVNQIDNLEISYDSLKKWCQDNHEEGLVFWEIDDDGYMIEPIAKIRRKDFGVEW